MYRDDDKARDERASVLIDEIAELERARLAQAAAERRLEEAKRELAMLRPTPASTPPAPGVTAHVAVFVIAALAASAGYQLLF